MERRELEALPKDSLIDLIIELRALVKQQGEEIAELKRLLRLDSRTSSKPPSSDHPKPPVAPGGKRKKGPPHGHRGVTRLDFGRVDVVQEVPLPAACPGCAHALAAATVTTESHIVAELVAQPVVITEYRQAKAACPHCGSHVRGVLPDDVLPGQQYGPRLQAWLNILGSWAHVSLAKQEELCEALLAIPISQGTLSTLRQRSSEALAEPVLDLQAWLRQQAVIGMDETGWRVNGQRAYLWTVTTPQATLLHVANSRSSQVIRDLLGETFDGTIVCDFYKSYDKYKPGQRQRCLAHLLRDVDACGLSKEVQDQRFAVRVGRYLREVFHLRAGRPRQWASAWPVSKRLWHYLRYELSPEVPKLTARLRKRMLKYWDQLWRWEANDQIPPDNNGSERALRLGVTQRKVSGGSRSDWGMVGMARLLTVVQSCRQQRGSPVEFLRQALLAKAHAHLEAPTLIPSRA